MTKREAAEIFIKYGTCNEDDHYVSCMDCKFIDECKAHELRDVKIVCPEIAEQWLKDNPEESVSDWQELKIDDLPGDILVGDYEFQIFDEIEGWAKSGSDIFIILSCAKELRRSFKYRKRQPEKKEPSHDFIMDNRWFLEKTGWAKVDYFNIDGTGFKYHFPSFDKSAFLRASDFQNMQLWVSIEPLVYTEPK